MRVRRLLIEPHSESQTSTGRSNVSDLRTMYRSLQVGS